MCFNFPHYPADEAWSGGAGGDDAVRLTAALDVLVSGLLEQRALARASKPRLDLEAQSREDAPLAFASAK